MKYTMPQFSSMLVFLAILLTACSGQVVIEPTATIVPALTETPVPSPTPTITLTPTQTTTPTLPPTETPDLRPASLTGKITLSGSTTGWSWIRPFASSVELHQKDSFDLIGKADTDSNADFKIDNINAGLYDLWVLITTKEEMVIGCADVAPPDNEWGIGVIFEDQALTIGNAYLSKALSLILTMQDLQKTDLEVQGFYAVLVDFQIEGGIENKMDVTLLCR